MKAEECLRLEEERINSYLHHSSRGKLLRYVESELLAQHKNPLLFKEHSGCRALLMDDKVGWQMRFVGHMDDSIVLHGVWCDLKVDDLARMYRLFNRVPNGLEPVASLFKQHVDSEGMKRVKEATEAVEEKRGRDAGRARKSSFAWASSFTWINIVDL